MITTTISTIRRLERNINTSLDHVGIDGTGQVSPNGHGNDANLLTIEPHVVLGSNPARGLIKIEGLSLDFNFTEISSAGAHASVWRARIDGAAKDNVGNCIEARGRPGSVMAGMDISYCDLLDAGFHGGAFLADVKDCRLEHNYAEGCGYRALHIHGDA